MPENRRVRLEDDLERYLATQAQRILGKPLEELTSADYSTLTNRCLYEHRQVMAFTHQIPLGRLVDWLLTAIPSGRNLTVIPHGRAGESAPASDALEDYSLDFQLGEMFEEAA